MSPDARPVVAAKRLMIGTSVAVALAVLPAVARAQNPVQTTFATCPAPSAIYSARQVQQPARLISDSLRLPRLSPDTAHARDIVSFVVDTLGVPERATFANVRAADSALVQRAGARLATWRFSPAVATGCKVRQRVVVSVTDR